MQLRSLVRAAIELPARDINQTDDPETAQFISYWFAPRQKADLARLATALREYDQPVRDALAVALSRIIISKEMMASLARDTSHSRPHKVAHSNDFDVIGGFTRSCAQLAHRLNPQRIKSEANINLADARSLDWINDHTIDLALTSPPYLNAIDYIRGHRLALVWLGYEIAPLREIRSDNIGAERAICAADSPFDISPFVNVKSGSELGDRYKGWIRRYASDMGAVLRELRRVIKGSGQVVMVLGNSFLRGSRIDNAGLVESLAEAVGFRTEERSMREIPARRRYLPPPGSSRSSLDARMRTETVLTLTVS